MSSGLEAEVFTAGDGNGDNAGFALDSGASTAAADATAGAPHPGAPEGVALAAQMPAAPAGGGEEGAGTPMVLPSSAAEDRPASPAQTPASSAQAGLAMLAPGGTAARSAAPSAGARSAAVIGSNAAMAPTVSVSSSPVHSDAGENGIPERSETVADAGSPAGELAQPGAAPSGESTGQAGDQGGGTSAASPTVSVGQSAGPAAGSLSAPARGNAASTRQASLESGSETELVSEEAHALDVTARPAPGAPMAGLPGSGGPGSPMSPGGEPLGEPQLALVVLPQAGESTAPAPESPRPADLLTSFLPFDRQSVESAIDRFLEHFEGLKAGAFDLREIGGLAPGIALAAAGITASVALLRRKPGGGVQQGPTEEAIDQLAGVSSLWQLRPL
jgi:hypothetical protein